jgi:flagellar hook assembly protein FlgD
MEILNPQGGNRKRSKYKPRVSNSLEKRISETTLSQNVPNPFNPTTTISYYLPAESHITLDIFDVNGTLVRNLAKAKRGRGLHQVVWDGKNDRGEFLSTGIYFYRLAVNGNTIDTKKMILLK